jgi:molecular chaperone GrpE (heat shock protein)
MNENERIRNNLFQMAQMSRNGKTAMLEAVKLIDGLNKAITHSANIIDGMVEDAKEIREKLIEVLDDVEVANTTTRLEEHDEALSNAIKSLAFIIDVSLNIEDEE